MSNQEVWEIVSPSGLDFAAIGVALVVYFFLSFLWWGPIFGKKWASYMGISMDEKPSMAVPMILQVIGTALIAYVLWTSMHAFTAVVDHDTGNLAMGEVTWMPAMTGAFFTWLGFFVPLQLSRVSWEKASWGLFGINVGGHLVGLVAMGVVFVLF